ncbi:hypothetical protein NQ318_016252 [Aromia moschata]|uniref:Uncharacterized protein n=1 Tax=Aromia moschata TaxID=1265417 RepID=A0AAV8XZX4_9CUCU|nr:hypothetical protein NQ318_016252 [Aromia moschata]
MPAAQRMLEMVTTASIEDTQRIEILMMMGYFHRKPTENGVRDIFYANYSEHQIHRSIVKESCKNLSSGVITGPTKVPEDVELDVHIVVGDNPHSITRQVGLYVITMHRILKRQKYHPYKLRLTHELTEDDIDPSIEFWGSMQNRCNDDKKFVSDIIFSDEATFCMNATVNRQNC